MPETRHCREDQLGRIHGCPSWKKPRGKRSPCSREAVGGRWQPSGRALRRACAGFNRTVIQPLLLCAQNNGTGPRSFSEGAALPYSPIERKELNEPIARQAGRGRVSRCRKVRRRRQKNGPIRRRVGRRCSGTSGRAWGRRRRGLCCDVDGAASPRKGKQRPSCAWPGQWCGSLATVENCYRWGVSRGLWGLRSGRKTLVAGGFVLFCRRSGRRHGQLGVRVSTCPNSGRFRENGVWGLGQLGEAVPSGFVFAPTPGVGPIDGELAGHGVFGKLLPDGFWWQRLRCGGAVQQDDPRPGRQSGR